MFSSIGWSELLILLVAALIILGPERLPGAIRWTTTTLRNARDWASGTTGQLRQQLGPEFDDLRQPLADLQELRNMTPRAMVTKHLLNNDDSLIKNLEDSIPNLPLDYSKNTEASEYPVSTPQKPLSRNEKPPIDTEAT